MRKAMYETASEGSRLIGEVGIPRLPTDELGRAWSESCREDLIDALETDALEGLRGGRDAFDDALASYSKVRVEVDLAVARLEDGKSQEERLTRGGDVFVLETTEFGWTSGVAIWVRAERPEPAGFGASRT